MKYTVSEDTEVVLNGKKYLLESGDKIAINEGQIINTSIRGIDSLDQKIHNTKDKKAIELYLDLKNKAHKIKEETKAGEDTGTPAFGAPLTDEEVEDVNRVGELLVPMERLKKHLEEIGSAPKAVRWLRIYMGSTKGSLARIHQS